MRYAGISMVFLLLGILLIWMKQWVTFDKLRQKIYDEFVESNKYKNIFSFLGHFI